MQSRLACTTLLKWSYERHGTFISQVLGRIHQVVLLTGRLSLNTETWYSKTFQKQDRSHLVGGGNDIQEWSLRLALNRRSAIRTTVMKMVHVY